MTMLPLGVRIGVRPMSAKQFAEHANAMLKTKENPSFCGMHTKPNERMQICWKYQCFKENIPTKEKYNRIRNIKNFHKIACKDAHCQLLKQKVFMEDNQ